MSDSSLSDNQSSPPSGDSQQAEQYISKLATLIEADKLLVNRTDLSKFDPSNLQDHYQMELKDYIVEASHTKHPSSGQDAYILLFTNLKQVREGCSEKIILAYMHLTTDQFQRIKHVSLGQIDRKKKETEAKRLKAVMAPIDQVLEMITSSDQKMHPNTPSLPDDVFSSTSPA